MRFVGFLVWLLAFAAQPALAQVPPQAAQLPPQPARFAPQPAQVTPPHLQALERRLAALAIENPGEYGFAAQDLESRAIVSFNGNRAFPMASTMKIAVAAAYLAEVDAGRRSLDDMIGGVSARALMDSMITRSNNRSTDMLIATLGGPAAIDRWIRGHGLTGIRVDRTIAQLLSDRRDLTDIRDSSTPVAMLDLLRLIDSGNALSASSRSLLLDMMRRCATGSNRIRGLLPPGARVAHKTGTLNGYTSDVGYLTLPDGRRIAVVFFARGGSNRPAVISTAARAVYDAFGTTGPAHGLQGLQGLQGRVVQASSGPSAATGLPQTPQTPQSQPSAGACTLGGRAVAAQC